MSIRIAGELVTMARAEAYEECATIALEQRCERNTDWDRACVAIAEAIRRAAITAGDRDGA